MDYVKIGGKAWDVLVTKVTESYEVLYSDNTGRTIAVGAPLTLDPLGTFITHSVTFKRKKGHEEEFDKLFEYLYQPRSAGFSVELVHGQTTLSYIAYSSNGSRELLNIIKSKGLVNWNSMTVKFIPIQAQVTP